ncbi:MAG: hypothetical protein QM536_02015 [Chitinophagaceae bacterium]|nr:hypothetical protein [Chitinophagaceae bacterium]
MRNIFIVVLLFFTLSSSEIFAQSKKNKQAEKAERKKWEKEKDKMDPLKYKELINRVKNADESIAELEKCKQEQSVYQQQMTDKEAELETYKSQIAEWKSLIEQLQKSESDLKSKNQELENRPMGGGSITQRPGMVFYVQIGAYASKDITEIIQNQPFIFSDKKDESIQYVLGIFGEKEYGGLKNAYSNADKLKKYLRQMGVKKAWIVPYKDGQRVDLKNVIEGVTE